MSFFNIKIEPIVNQKYLDIVEDFYFQQNKMNSIIDKLTKFAQLNSSDSISIFLETKDNKSNIISQDDLSLHFWIRFVITINNDKSYISLIHSKNEINDIYHEDFKILCTLMSKFYSEFDIESIIEQYKSFVDISKKVKQTKENIIYEDFDFKCKYIKDYLKKNFLNLNNNLSQQSFSFKKIRAAKKILFERFGNTPLITLNVPTYHNNFLFLKNDRFFNIEIIKKRNTEIFELFPEDFFFIKDVNLTHSYNTYNKEEYCKIECKDINVDYLYEKIKLKNELKNF